MWTKKWGAAAVLALGVVVAHVGAAFADEDNVFAPGKDQYTYWNAGLTLAVEKFAFDFRHWNTNIDLGVYDERFVFAATVTLP